MLRLALAAERSLSGFVSPLHRGRDLRIRTRLHSLVARALTGHGAATALGLAALLAAGCHHLGQYVWVDAYRDPGGAARSYRISRGDLIFIRVWNQDSLSGRARVRSDGMVSLPLLNDVEAAGIEPPVLAHLLQARLKEFVVNPNVTVSLEEAAPFEVSVLGEVTRPGVYRLDAHASVLQALASAGGLSLTAGHDRIFVLRREGTDDSHPPLRIRFTYEALAHAQGAAARFRLHPADVIVVE